MGEKGGVEVVVWDREAGGGLWCRCFYCNAVESLRREGSREEKEEDEEEEAPSTKTRENPIPKR